MKKYILILLFICGVSFGQTAQETLKRNGWITDKIQTDSTLALDSIAIHRNELDSLHSNKVDYTDSLTLFATPKQSKELIADSLNALRPRIKAVEDSIGTHRIELNGLETTNDNQTDSLGIHRGELNSHESRLDAIVADTAKYLEKSDSTLYATQTDLSTKVNVADSNSTLAGGYITRKYISDNFGNLTNKLQVEVEDSTGYASGNYMTWKRYLDNLTDANIPNDLTINTTKNLLLSSGNYLFWGGGFEYILGNESTHSLILGTNNISALSINSTQDVTLTGALTGTSLSMSGEGRFGGIADQGAYALQTTNFYASGGGTFGGNVGIGTTSPSEKLDVTGNIKASGALTLGASGGTSGSLTFIASDNDQGTVRINTSRQLVMANFSTVYFQGSGAVQAIFENSTQGAFTVRKTGLSGWSFATGASGEFGFYDNDAAAWRQYFKSGNVGFGTINPTYKVDINGTFHVSGVSTFDNSATFGGAVSIISNTSPTLHLTKNAGIDNRFLRLTDNSGSGYSIDQILSSSGLWSLYDVNGASGTLLSVDITSRLVTVPGTLNIGSSGGISGSLTWIASDNDQANVSINTSDQLVFSGATGGYSFDNRLSIASDGPGLGVGINIPNILIAKDAGFQSIGFRRTDDSGASTQGGWFIGSGYSTVDDFAIFQNIDISTAPSARLYFSNTGNATFSGSATFGGSYGNTAQQTSTLAAAATTLALTKNVLTVTGDGGGNTLATLTGGVVGTYTLIFVDALVTITDTDAHTANTIDLVGTATNLTSADDLVLQVVFDGTSFYEVSRSAN